MHLNFIASNQLDPISLGSIDSFVENQQDVQTVWLADENELNLLFDLMGLPAIKSFNTGNRLFSKYWDLSEFKLPEFNAEGFDKFYEDWIQRSGRENSMNEYGSLLFLQGLSPEWNKLKYRVVILEDDNGS